MTMLQHELTDFTANIYQDNQFSKLTKADVLGHWSLIFFYPNDFSFVCPTELEDLADHYDEFKKAGCEIYGVSHDTEFVHKAWHEANEKIAKIQFPMVADPTNTLSRDLDSYDEVNGQAERGDFILSPEGKVVAYEVISSNVGRNAEEILRRVEASQFVYEHGDQVCPAKWEPGDETIAPSLDLVGQL
ncbi:MAG: redoxin domain-containing protein [Bifidobacterium sp.]|nr:redoxin domain-containing protein [Bifidobacterium sp.]